MLAAAALLLAGVVPVVDTWEASCRVGRGTACHALGVASADGAVLRHHDGRATHGKALAQDPARAARMFRAGCDVDHVPSCAEACADGDDEACGRLEVDPRVAAQVRTVRAGGARITDPEHLEQIAMHAPPTDTDDTSGTAAVRRIQDRVRLLRLAESAPNGYVRGEAMRSLAPADVIALARLSPQANVRRAAAFRLDAQDVLAEIVRADRVASVRQAAAMRLSDPTVLLDVARHDEDQDVRLAAVDRIADPRALNELAWHSPDIKVRVAAARGIKDGALLDAIATAHADSAVRVAALRGPVDPALAAGLARDDKDPAVRVAAARSLVANHSPRYRGPEVTRLRRELARRSPDPAVRAAAAESRERPRPTYENGNGSAFAGLAFGSDGPVMSLGFVVGGREAASHSIPTFGLLTGPMVQAEIGRDALRMNLGLATVMSQGPFTAGLAVKATFGNSERFGDEIGGEIELAYLARLTAGVAHGPHGTRFTWAVGLGF